MPELPEVEFGRRILERCAVGRRIARARVPPSRVLGGVAPEKVARFLRGSSVLAAKRHGKHLLLELDRDRALHLHFGMSGRFVENDPHVTHARLVLELDDGTTLALADARMFGRVEIGTSAELRRRLAEELGPDALLDKPAGKTLRALLSRTKRPIKIALLDQTLLAGLGNIYAAEALWRARIHPETRACDLDLAGANQLARAISVALRHGLENVEGDDGEAAYLQDGADNPFIVYGREGEPCRRCKTTAISKSEQGGRSTYYCSTCQIPPGGNKRGRGSGR